MDEVIDLSETPEQVARPVLNAGIYNATVKEVSYGRSRKGNPMLTWSFDVTDADNKEWTLFYHTTLNDERGKSNAKRAIIRLLSDDEEMDWAQWKPGDMSWVEGRACRLKVGIQNNDEFGKSNSIRDVLKAQEGFLQ